jgi:hypothetical protein
MEAFAMLSLCYRLHEVLAPLLPLSDQTLSFIAGREQIYRAAQESAKVREGNTFMAKEDLHSSQSIHQANTPTKYTHTVQICTETPVESYVSE